MRRGLLSHQAQLRLRQRRFSWTWIELAIMQRWDGAGKRHEARTASPSAGASSCVAPHHETDVSKLTLELLDSQMDVEARDGLELIQCGHREGAGRAGHFGHWHA